MSDLIDRNEEWRNEIVTKGAAVDALKEPEVRGDYDDFGVGQYTQWEDDACAIKALPSAQPECKRECTPMYANVSDCISRQAAINAPVRMVSEGIEWIPVYHVEQLPSAQPKRKPGKTLAEEVERIKHELTDIFTEQMSAQPQRMNGKWIHDGYDIPHGVDWMHCSVCGRREPYVPAAMTNYCSGCGADMREGGNNVGTNCTD